MSAHTPISYLAKIRACRSAIYWVAAGKFTDLESAWIACDDPRWLLWFAGRVSGGPDTKARKKVVHLAVECADAAYAADAGHTRVLQLCTEIVKKHYPTLPHSESH